MADAPPVFQMGSFPLLQQVPTIYFNGFSLQLSNSDISVMLIADGRPVCKLNMSFTTAKTLNENLSSLIQNLEKVTNHTIMLAGEVETGLKNLVSDSGS